MWYTGRKKGRQIDVCGGKEYEKNYSYTSQWIYGIDAVITDLSQGITLEAGTVIAMGTPAGVGMGFDPPKYLKPGDTVECEVEGIGTLINTIK